MSVITVTTENFEEIINQNPIVLIDFWASWCMPCKMLSPIVDEVAQEADFTVGKINVDEQSALAEKFGIMSIPTLMVFKNGEMVKKQAGVMSKLAILDLVK